MTEKPTLSYGRASRRTLGHLLPLAALGIEVVGALWASWLCTELNSVPRGSSIRPMGLVAMEFLIGGGAGLLGFAVGAIGVATSRRVSTRLLGLLAMVLSVAPLIVSSSVFSAIVAKRALMLEP